MVTRTVVPTRCVKQLAIMGWVSHAAGVLSVATSLATEHWLRRLPNGHHVGIFPCCPAFQCDKKTISNNGQNINAFTDIIIVGLLLVGLGLVLSLTYTCVSWRSDKRTLFGMSYIASGFVLAGGITLVAGAIEFVMTIPGDMEDALREECQELNDIVQTGFSYGLFVTGAVAFIIAGVLLLLSSCRQSHPSLLTRRVIRPSIAISESSMSLETVSAHLELQGRLSPMLRSFSESFNNPVYEADEERPISIRMRRLSSQAFLCLCERLSQYDSENQSGRLSPNVFAHESGRLSPQSHSDTLFPHGSARQSGRLSPHQGDRLSPLSFHQSGRLSPHRHGDRLSPHVSPHQRDRLSPHDSAHQGGRLSPHHHGDRLSPHHQGDRLSPHHHGGRLSPHHHGDRLSPHHQGDRLSPRDSQSPHNEHEFRPITSPPSYESLQEFFLLNIPVEPEFSENRQTTELHDLRDNSPENRESTELHDLQDDSQESAVQPPTYEDVVKTYPPPYTE